MHRHAQSINDAWWQRVRPGLTLVYLLVALILLIISATGHWRLLSEANKTFGGFFWAIDTDGEIVVVSTPPQLPPFEIMAASLTSNPQIIAINKNDSTKDGGAGFTSVYEQTRAGEPIAYTVLHSNNERSIVMRPAVTFTWDMWWQNYGLALLAGISWLAVGWFLLSTAAEWTGAVEGITLLPPAMLFLLYSHWGNVQQAYAADGVFQLLWVPSFALLGAAFIHLSLTYRPEELSQERMPRMRIDALPYLPVIPLIGYEWISFLLSGHVPTRINLIASLGYAALGGLISLGIGIHSLLQIGRFLPGKRFDEQGTPIPWIPAHIRHRIGDLLTLWIGGIGLGFCLGVLPILLMGKTLLPLSTFYILAAIYPLILLYAIRSLRLLDRLQVTLNSREEALNIQQKTAEELLQTNKELEQAKALLLHADAHLRSLLSQRIHDQPRQQALRIRSLLGHWQHKLRVEAERDPADKVAVRPIIEALGKVRKISEELEGDLRGLQLLVEDTYQLRSLGLKLHLEKLLREDLPALHPESLLKVQADLWALDAFSPDRERTEEGAKIAEAVSYTVTQALLNIYNHAGATTATIRTTYTSGILEVSIHDDGHGFNPNMIPPEKMSLFKARLKVGEVRGSLGIYSIPRPQEPHGTTITLRVPLPRPMSKAQPEALIPKPLEIYDEQVNH